MEVKHTLANGVRLLTEEIPHVHSAVVGFWFDTGSKNETPVERGISHFIEHMLFKGTPTRTALDIVQAIEDTGGSLNAFTDREVTCYYARVLEEHLPLALATLSDMVTHALMAVEDVTREKSVVLEEIKLYEDSPDDQVHDLLLTTVWPDHPLGRAIIGTADTVKAFERAHLLDYMRRLYTPDRLVVSVAGRIDRQRVIEQLEALLGHLKPEAVEPAPIIPPLSLTSGRQFRHKDIEQAYLAIGTRGLAVTEERRYVLAVLDNILGGGMSSRLYQEVREKRGLVYSIHSFQALYRHGGLFGVYAATSPERVGEVYDVVENEFRKVAEGSLTDHELRRAKEQIKGGLLLGLEAVRNRMTRMARNELFFGRFIPVEELIARIEKVDRESVIELAQEILPGDRQAVCLVGPFEEMPEALAS